jgi:hypothetical protein
MDLAGNLRGKCRKHGTKCVKYITIKPDSHTCVCGCPAFEHVSCIHSRFIDRPPRVYIFILKNSLIIHEENTKKNHKRVVSVYVIQIHVDLHKL